MKGKSVWIIASLPALALVCACGKKEAVAQADTKAGKKDPGAVHLEAALQKEAGIEIETVSMRALAQTLRAPARVTQDENSTWRVGAVTDGRLVTVSANVGDVVKANQVLARLHSHDIHESRAEHQKALAELRRAEEAEVYARKVRDRAKRLYELKAGSLADAEHAEAEVRNARTAVANAKTELERTRFHLEDFLGVTAVDQHGPAQPHTEEEMAPVKAPRDGVVVSRAVSVGSVVTPGAELFSISDLSRVWAIAEVQEDAIARLRVGMPARLFVNAYGEQAFQSRVSKISESLDAATRTVKVRLELANPGMKLRPEMYGTVEIETGGVESGVMMLPGESVQDVRGASVVFVQTADTRFELKPVETGRKRDGRIEIVKGLKPGDRVAVKGVFILKSEFLKAALAEEE